ncbi:hypothetical protein ACVW00_001490 [Marmoricola sp. URHA0025 HA25]
MTRLSTRALTTTLWLRQQLVPGHRTVHGTAEMVEHLIGLQAQDNLPPYLSLAARIGGFDPQNLSGSLERRHLVRFRTMRGTVHVLTPEDALTLRPWVQPALDRVSGSSAQNKPAAGLTNEVLTSGVRKLTGGAAVPIGELALGLAEEFPDVPEPVLRHVVPERVPLLHAPPRGLWKQSGGVVYALADEWLGRPFAEPDVRDLVRRYLRAYGPATPADMTKWSAVSRLAPVFKDLHAAGELVTHTDDQGRTLYDVPDGVLADEDLALPTVMLGTYDNLFLSHADRDRVAPDEMRRRWMGPNGGVGPTLFVDGLLAGSWRFDGSVFEVEPYRPLAATERRAVEGEKERIAELLAR